MSLSWVVGDKQVEIKQSRRVGQQEGDAVLYSVNQRRKGPPLKKERMGRGGEQRHDLNWGKYSSSSTNGLYRFSYIFTPGKRRGSEASGRKRGCIPKSRSKRVEGLIPGDSICFGRQKSSQTGFRGANSSCAPGAAGG